MQINQYDTYRYTDMLFIFVSYDRTELPIVITIVLPESYLIFILFHKADFCLDENSVTRHVKPISCFKPYSVHLLNVTKWLGLIYQQVLLETVINHYWAYEILYELNPMIWQYLILFVIAKYSWKGIENFLLNLPGKV